MKRVLFVANDYSNFVHHRSHLIRAVAHAGGEVTVLAGGDKPKEPLSFKFVFTRIERFSFHWSDVVLFFKILYFISLRRPDIVHLVNLKPYLYGGMTAQLAKLLGWKGRLVVTVPGLGRLFSAADNEGLKTRLVRTIIPVFLKQAIKGAVVTFETVSDRDFWIANRFVNAKDTVVTNGTGLDFSQFPLKEFESSGRPLTVLYAGRLLRSKGLDVVLTAAELNDQDSIQICVAGFKEQDPDAVSTSDLYNHPKVKFLGGVKDMGALLAEVDVVVLPSRYNEGIPRILLEAAACGCVLVATRFPGSEALIQEGQTGFFLKSGDKLGQADELVRLLQRLSSDPSKLHEIGKKASEFVRNNGFSSEAITLEFSKIYNLN
ncbi:glycosyltransferase [Brucella pseudogrignonensis]|uniref:glycosyltransferase n=1 Tax=Brucella pseudogrignonensis TaxID=419475 RepID=UPI003D958D31